jgi:hypothetical protein
MAGGPDHSQLMARRIRSSALRQVPWASLQPVPGLEPRLPLVLALAVAAVLGVQLWLHR